MNWLRKIRLSIAAWLRRYGGERDRLSMGMMALLSGSSLGMVLRSILKGTILLSKFFLAIAE